MAHGTKAYGRTAAIDTVYGIQDMGELAARLGSIDTHDRRGNVLWMDDFENGVLAGKWSFVEHTAVTVEVGLSTLRPKRGAFATRIAFTAAALVNDYGRIRNRFCYPSLGKTGLEASFTSDDTRHNITVAMYRFDGTWQYSGSLQFDESTGVLSYLNSAGAYVAIAAIATQVFAYCVVKLVIDLALNRYIRAIFNDVEFDLSAQGLRVTASAVTPVLEAMLRSVIVVLPVGATSTHFDDVILTTNEP